MFSLNVESFGSFHPLISARCPLSPSPEATRMLPMFVSFFCNKFWSISQFENYQEHITYHNYIKDNFIKFVKIYIIFIPQQRTQTWNMDRLYLQEILMHR